MSVYSTRLLLFGLGGPSRFVVPAGKVAVVRYVGVFNSAAVHAAWYVSINGTYALGGVLAPYAPNGPTPTAYSEGHDVRFVLTADEVFDGAVETGVTMNASGYLFSSL